MDFKIGQGVEVTHSRFKGLIGVLIMGVSDFTWFVKLNNGITTDFHIDYLKPLPKSWDTLAVGDILISTDKRRVRVLSIHDNVIDVSSAKNHYKYRWTDTKEEFERCEWKIETEENSDVENAIKLLTDRGVIVDGKVLK